MRKKHNSVQRNKIASNKKKLEQKVGQTPGTLIYTGEGRDGNVEIETFSYNETFLEERKTESFETSIEIYNESHVNWINIIGLYDIDIINKVGEAFELHPLLLEDVLNIEQRPKSEDFGNYIFFTIKMFHQQTESGIEYEHVSFVLGKNFIISFQEKPKDIFNLLRERMRNSHGKMRTKKADYLFYRFVDTIVDNYYFILDNFAEKIEAVEEEAMENPNTKTLQKIQQLKKELIYLRRSVYPLRESVNAIIKSESVLIVNDTEKYFRDVYDHTIHVIESLETYRDLLGGIMDLYMNSVSNRMNEIMKVLTIMSSIFIPITFLAGVYGMNFKYMPELNHQYGYPALLGIMLVVIVIMIFYFKKKKWF